MDVKNMGKPSSENHTSLNRKERVKVKSLLTLKSTGPFLPQALTLSPQENSDKLSECKESEKGLLHSVFTYQNTCR